MTQGEITAKCQRAYSEGGMTALKKLGEDLKLTKAQKIRGWNHIQPKDGSRLKRVC